MEIEIRAFVDDLKEIEQRVEEIGGKLESTQHIVDMWFCEKKYSKFEQVQQNEPGSYGLRIRKIEEEGKEIIELNCKILEEEGDHNAFHEFETKIENLDQGRKILEGIGFKVFCTVDKKRKTFTLNNISINLEDIKGYKPAVELEIIDDSNVEEHKTKLRNMLDKLGIKEEDKIEKSITYLYMKEFAFKE